MGDPDPLLSAMVFCEALATVVLLALAARAAWSLARRAELPWSAALFALALFARWRVPWVPSNFYSDLPNPFGAYRANELYTNPFYDLLSHLSRSPDAVYVANVVVGSLAAVAAHLALLPPDRAAAPVEAMTARLAALGLALLPLFVRTAASDAPHTWGLWLFWLGGLCAAHHGHARARSAAIGVGLAVYLVGATRGELAPAAAVLLGALALRALPRPFTRAALARLAVSLALGAALALQGTALACFGFLNGDFRLSASLFAQWARGLAPAAALRGDLVPDSERLGLLLFVVASVARRRPAGVAVYALLLPLVTVGYAVEAAFASSWAAASFHPMMRYALLWQQLPLYFAARGFAEAAALLPRRVPPLAREALVLVVIAATTGPAVYHRGATFAFQAEHRFLRDFAAAHRDARPIVVGWRKNAGGDLVEALAAPYFSLRAVDPRRRWVTFDGSLDDLRRLDARERGDALFFFGALATAAEQPDERPCDTARLLRDVAIGRCVVRSQGRRVAARDWLVPSSGRIFARSTVALRTELWLSRFPLEFERWEGACAAAALPLSDRCPPTAPSEERP